MHRAIRNALRLELSIVPVTPLLIAAGPEGQFVRYPHPVDGAPTAYLPASTLKGALRWTGEQIMAGSGLFCCESGTPCSEREAVRRAADGAAVYRALCGICRIFGSHALSSHLAITDGYPAEALDDLPIYALSDNGGSCESVRGDAFEATLTLRNFERWQVGFLGAALTRITAGNAALGANRSYGMGRVIIRYTSAAISYFGFYEDELLEQLSTRLHGVGQLVETPTKYDFVSPDVGEAADLPRAMKLNSGFGYAEAALDGRLRSTHTAVEELLEGQQPAWESYVLARRATTP